MKNKKMWEILLLIITAIVIYILVKDNYKEIGSAIIHANIPWLLVAFILYVIFLLLQTIPFYSFVRFYDKKIKFSYMFYLIVVTNFFNGITPQATGGQPLQVYELHKKKLSTLDATNAVIQNAIVFQFAQVIWFLIAIIINSRYHLFTVTPTLRNLTIIGMSLNTFLLIILFIITFSKNFNRKIIHAIINILAKIHIVKHKDKQMEKWDKTCDDFYHNSIIMLRNKWKVLGNIFVLLIAFTFYYAIPLCISNALGNNTIDLLTCLVVSNYVFLASNYIPIPGATGGMEYSFMGYFGNYVAGHSLKAMLIIWRFITYYLPIIVGAIAFDIGSLKRNKDSK